MLQKSRLKLSFAFVWLYELRTPKQITKDWANIFQNTTIFFGHNTFWMGHMKYEMDFTIKVYIYFLSLHFLLCRNCCLLNRRPKAIMYNYVLALLYSLVHNHQLEMRFSFVVVFFSQLHNNAMCCPIVVQPLTHINASTMINLLN